MLVVLLVGAAPVRAASITFEDVMQAVGASGQLRPANEVRLRYVQSGRAAGQQQPQAPQTLTQESSTAQPKTDVAPGGGATGSDPTLSQSGGGQVETVDLGDVTGTVCDCGELPGPVIRGGGFPWWPFLGAIPLICVSGVCFDSEVECENPPCITPPPTTTPTPPTEPIPEPATLLLFGTGLLAVAGRARRRFGRKSLDAQTAAAEEV
jgi:hypothetical protein